MADIGDWELDLVESKIYWSSMVKAIHEVEDDYEADLENALLFYKEGENRETITRAVNQIIETGEPFDLELELITAKGNERWVRVVGEAELWDGKCIRIYGSTQNIDNRKRAEIARNHANEEKKRILDRIGDAFFALDKEWTVTYWNKRAEEVIGKKQEELLGNNLWEVFPEARKLKFFREYKRAFDEQVSVHFEEYYPPLERWLEAHGYPSKEGLSVFFRDITEKKQAEERLRLSNEKLRNALQQLEELNRELEMKASDLEASNTELEQFAYVASHDLQEPLRMVTNFLEQLQIKYDNQLDKKAREYIHFAVDGANRMQQIILDLLQYSKAGRTEKKLKKIDLNRLLEEIIKTHQPLCNDLEAEIHWEHLPEISGVETTIFQLFQNLIGNALKYHKPGTPPLIKIECQETDSFWQFSISDNGIGFEAEYSESIFNIFTRLHTHEDYPGTGIGLAICKKIVEQHGGSIQAKSNEYEGATFSFTLEK